MLEATVADGTEKLRLEHEVAETGRVDANVAALLINGAARGELGLLAVGGGGGLRRLDLLIGVVDEIFLVRHGGGLELDARCWGCD